VFPLLYSKRFIYIPGTNRTLLNKNFSDFRFRMLMLYGKSLLQFGMGSFTLIDQNLTYLAGTGLFCKCVQFIYQVFYFAIYNVSGT
jgi:hypothetical protein